MRDYTPWINRQMVQEFGWIIQPVLPTRNTPGIPYFHTIGLCETGLPELIISALLAPEKAQTLLNELARVHLRDTFEPGDTLLWPRVDNTGMPPLRVVETRDPPVQQAYEYAQDPYNATGRVQVVQILWPDRAGRYPDQDGYNQADEPQEMFS